MRFWPKREAPLRGVPPVRRRKNYTAITGFVYEYFHEGFRDAAGAREDVFSVSGDRKTWFRLSVFVPDAAVAEWQAAHGRPLEDNERYAVAKMALFESFDERANPAAMNAPVHVSAAQVEELLGRLGVD